MTVRLLALAAAAFLAVLPAAAQTPPTEPTGIVFGHFGRSDGQTTGGLGVLWVNQEFAFGLDISVEGSERDETYGKSRVKNARSINLWTGIPVYGDENVTIIPFGLIGMRSHKTTCPTGDSYLGLQCYADYEPKTRWKINYGGGVLLQFESNSIGVRVTGESIGGVLGINW